jgi:hypothetical protein
MWRAIQIKAGAFISRMLPRAHIRDNDFPEVGITRLEYVHHGTVASEHVRLLEFKPGH